MLVTWPDILVVVVRSTLSGNDTIWGQIEKQLISLDLAQDESIVIVIAARIAESLSCNNTCRL
jgi:hypothetical protein